MNLSRRRFLTISAAAAAMPGHARAATWRGTAFGAEIGLTIRAPREQAAAAITRSRAIVDEIEALFSLYRPDSALSRLNATGRLTAPDARFVALMAEGDRAFRLTGGRFDPTVQPYWQALATGRDAARAAALIGWDRVRFDARAVVLAPGQALTFNGIAQGFATDLVTEALAASGLGDVLVDIGEYRARGGPWRIGIGDPGQGVMGYQTLTGQAVATSSPAALSLGAEAHILHPRFAPRWSTVSVTAQSATLADSLSTALCLAPLSVIEGIAALPQVHRIRLVDMTGDLRSL